MKINLAVFYKNFGYSRGLVLLGRLDDGLELLSGSGSVRVTLS